MRVRTRGRVLTAAGMALVLTAGSAWACEGWVMWHGRDGDRKSLEPKDAYATKSACEHAYRRFITNQAAMIPNTVDLGHGWIKRSGETYVYVCYPSDFDPRR